jgi:hypothetical protein
MRRRVPIVELAICCVAVAVQIAAAILVRRTCLQRELRHDVPPWLAFVNAWAWVGVAVLVAVLALARPPPWVWSVLASLSCIAAIALYVVGYYL